MKKSVILSGSLFGLLGWLLYPVCLLWVGEFLVVADPLEKAEAIALLGGDEDPRIAAGALLFRQGYGSWFIMMNIDLRTTAKPNVYRDRVTVKAVEAGVPAERILIVPEQVSTTYEEAVRLKEFAVTQGFHSLIVVTSPYHTRRARWLLRQVFRDSGVRLAVRPVLNHPYQAKDWWSDPIDRQLTALEYAKALAHLLGCRDYDACGPVSGDWLWSLQPTGGGQ